MNNQNNNGYWDPQTNPTSYNQGYPPYPSQIGPQNFAVCPPAPAPAPATQTTNEFDFASEKTAYRSWKSFFIHGSIALISGMAILTLFSQVILSIILSSHHMCLYFHAYEDSSIRIHPVLYLFMFLRGFLEETILESLLSGVSKSRDYITASSTIAIWIISSILGRTFEAIFD